MPTGAPRRRPGWRRTRPACARARPERSTTMSARVGVIGLGAIGLPLAVNLIGKGFEVHGYRRSPMDELKGVGGQPAASPRTMAEACDVIVTALPAYEDVREVLDGPRGALRAGRKDLVVIELSTLAMKEKEALRATVEGAGGVMLDAPLSGIPQMVKDRAAIVFASGDQAAWDRCKPVFDGMTDRAFFLGPFGVGTKMKFVANTLVGIHILAAAEAMALGVKAGLDAHLIVKLLSPSAASSLQFQVRAPMMAQRTYEPVLAPHPLLVKDLVKIAQFADELGSSAPLLHVARDYFTKACDTEWRGKDRASILLGAARGPATAATASETRPPAETGQPRLEKGERVPPRRLLRDGL